MAARAVESEKGDLKRQIASVVKPALSMYRFQTLGELRALLALYRIGVEEVGGTRGGRSYRECSIRCWTRMVRGRRLRR